MTNEQIIFENRVFLMEQGVIGAIEGESYTDSHGQEKPMPEEIHTFQAWKAKGYCVKKGEHAVAKFPIWKLAVADGVKGRSQEKEVKGEDEAGGKMFKKIAFFFTMSQVSPIK